MNIENCTAIITGGASGLGEATARLFHQLGARVAIFDRDRQRGEAIVAELGTNVRYQEVDVTDHAAVQAGVDEVLAAWSHIHICCNYAGIAPAVKTIGREGPGDAALFAKVININLIGTFNVSSIVAYAMSRNEPLDEDGSRGVIIQTASVAAYEGQIGQAAYSASKGGVVSMTLTMARDLARNGIRVNAIAPGLIHTPMFDAFPQEVYDSLSKQPLFPVRLGRAEEVAGLARHLVENNYINGAVLRMDAGIRMQPR
ncbi:NAD(P)-dependent dehydrogenase (short-subunit alcohol dehydrogenase family) [Lewinella marina]|uniref:3-hydroxyacyl-CoA dehydrogenase n=1 Tax=Neolewinella marina TaxID=438751 RepID=A0A2G0CG32_9BACT|nr:SDR family NAD(P)-dependent oxidoreductase [Neolewinella marina]NJB85431.1 NAD(P)-dependent dehydrogenase (short-subunit alcohol dehydrogenase family) [Neolewinella marina]PHK98877.1 3-hydroxyacyl-CoA dehydrogenase [Neolewinella marina]